MCELFFSCVFAVGARIIGVANSTCCCCCCCGYGEVLSCFIGQCLELLLVVVIVVAFRLTAVTFAFVWLIVSVAVFVIIIFVKNAAKVFPRALNLQAHTRAFDSEYATKTPEEKGVRSEDSINC